MSPSRPSSRGEGTKERILHLVGNLSPRGNLSLVDGDPKHRILHVVTSLRDENSSLRAEIVQLRDELAQVYALAGPLIEAVGPERLQIEAARDEEQLMVVPESNAVGSSLGSSSLSSDSEKQKRWIEKRSTVAAYDLIGADASDDVPTLKQKYRKEQLRMHPDKGGSHEDFLYLQAAATKLANKRQSFAAAIGNPTAGRRVSANTSNPTNGANSGKYQELESDRLALEPGSLALEAPATGSSQIC